MRDEEITEGMVEHCCRAVSPLYAEMADEWAREAIRANVRTVIKAAFDYRSVTEADENPII